MSDWYYGTDQSQSNMFVFLNQANIGLKRKKKVKQL